MIWDDQNLLLGCVCCLKDFFLNHLILLSIMNGCAHIRTEHPLVFIETGPTPTPYENSHTATVPSLSYCMNDLPLLYIMLGQSTIFI